MITSLHIWMLPTCCLRSMTLCWSKEHITHRCEEWTFRVSVCQVLLDVHPGVRGRDSFLQLVCKHSIHPVLHGRKTCPKTKLGLKYQLHCQNSRVCLVPQIDKVNRQSPLTTLSFSRYEGILVTAVSFLSLSVLPSSSHILLRSNMWLDVAEDSIACGQVVHCFIGTRRAHYKHL